MVLSKAAYNTVRALKAGRKIVGIGAVMTEALAWAKYTFDAYQNGWEFVMKKGEQEYPIDEPFLPKPRD